MRSAYRTRLDCSDLIGIFTFHTGEIRPGWVPPLLRDGGALPAEIVYSAGTCRFPAASPRPLWNDPSEEADSNEAFGQGFKSFTRPAIPLACDPRMERGFLGFSPHASDPAVTRDAREDGDRLLSTGLGLRHRHPPALPSTYPLTPSGLVPHHDLSLGSNRVQLAPGNGSQSLFDKFELFL